MNLDTSPTPRTDEAENLMGHFPDGEEKAWDFARQLERELIKKTAENQKLRELLERAFNLVEHVWLEDASPTEALAELQEKLNQLTK
jgi:hypothetical protein